VNWVPLRGQIVFVALPQDPPGKGPRPAIVVSLDARNRHPRAHSILIIPLSTSIHKAHYVTHLLLSAGETGLSEDSIARAEDVTVVLKSALSQSRTPLRTMSNRRVCELAEKVKLAMGC
jgi:mRNA-degrading endonuclease toxin of MazEF toxin-antitoxin module